MLLQKAIETPPQMPKPEELKGRQYCRWHNSWNHSTNSCVVFRDVIQEGITAGRLKLAEKSPACKCEAELEVVLNRQSQPMPSVFDRIGTSSRDKTGQEKCPGPAQRQQKDDEEQPKKEISIKMLGNDKPLAAIIEGRWKTRQKNMGRNRWSMMEN
ncbi:unnamed protein product [Prunus brigantina]